MEKDLEKDQSGAEVSHQPSTPAGLVKMKLVWMKQGKMRRHYEKENKYISKQFDKCTDGS